MIRTRLTIWNCVVLSLVLTIIGAAIYLSTERAILGGVDSGLLARAHAFATGWPGMPPSPPGGAVIIGGQAAPGQGPGRGFDGPGPGTASKSGGEFHEGPERWFTHEPGTGFGGPPFMDPAVARKEGIDPNQLRRTQAMADALRPMILGLNGKDIMHVDRKPWDFEGFVIAKAGQEHFSDGDYEGIPLRILSVPLMKDGKVAGVTQLSAPVASEHDQIRSLGKTLAIVLPLAVVVMLFTGALLTRQALRPVAQIASAAERIEATNLDGRLPILGRDEFAHLSTTFNTMLGRLQATFEEKDELYRQLRRFTSDASHELKTPLTAIRARTGIALRTKDPAKKMEHLRAIDRAAELMTSIVQDLLLLAASDEGQLKLHKETVDADDLVRDALASVDTSKHAVCGEVEPGIRISADPAAITRVLVNLLQNSIRHTDEGKKIEVSVDAKDGWVWFAVKDEGEGIPSEHVPLIFNRFHRVDKARDRESGGSGLGLAIAKAIVEAHGGEISLASTLGE
ncbi:MAG TPA: HAMP domain-containing sensor histidine kinase, partial [Fimbriimonadaceae bacterium]|nr:HAMP domain-containing sensor histidine kinase [Fimbriimonadaceae bacterium]